MDKTISAADANRAFSRLLREVQAGRSFVVTAHGRPVARIAPVSEEETVREAACAVLFARLRTQPVQDVGPWRRDDLYDDPA